MKFSKIIFVLVSGIFFTSNVFAQTIDANMVFENERHDFGKVKEEGGKVSYKFLFTNMGAEPIVINNVSSSCGCTTPSWSKEAVPPGGKGYIKALFNPISRPGKFHKTITVKSNATNSPVILHIHGDVIPKPKSINQEYRYVMGPLRLKKRNVHFAEILKTESKTEVLELINPGQDTVKVGFNVNRRMPDHLKIVCKPEILMPNQKGKITISYNAKLKNDWGYVYDRIYISFNEKQDYNNRMNISAVIKEVFTKEMINNPPSFTPINGKTFNFGTIKQGDKVEHIFTFKNTGKNDLIIRKTKASCGCTAVHLGEKVIKPGAEGSIKAVFNSRGKSGNQRKSVTITTNIPDVEGQPKKSQIMLMMTGVVEVPVTGENK